jgi:hypothetical protein
MGSSQVVTKMFFFLFFFFQNNNCEKSIFTVLRSENASHQWQRRKYFSLMVDTQRHDAGACSAVSVEKKMLLING